MENLARHIIQASGGDMLRKPAGIATCPRNEQYLDQEAKVVYTSKDGKSTKVFDALEWLAAMCSHIPNKGEQMVRYYGFYSNVSRGDRKKEDHYDDVPCILEPQEDEKAFRRNWARLIQKIYEVDPLVCPQCQGTMRIISSIEDREIIKAILKHLGLWLVRSKPPPKAHSPPAAAYVMDEYSQLSMNDDHLCRDPEYSLNAYIQS
jgi:hypothetical protein